MKKTDSSFRFLVFLLLVSILFMTRLFFGFITPLFFAALLTGMTFPFYKKIILIIDKRLNKKNNKNGAIGRLIFGNRRNVSSIMTVLMVVILILFPLMLVSILFLSEAEEIYSQVSGKITSVSQVNDFATSLIEKHPIVKKVYDRIVNDMGIDLMGVMKERLLPLANKMAGGVFKYAATILGNTVGVLINLFIMLLALFFLLINGKELGSFLIRLSPLKTKDEIKLYEVFREIGRGVIIGNTVAAMLQGFLAGLGLFLFSVPKPVFLGVLATFFSFIPFLGPMVVCVPAVLYMFYAGKTVSAVLLLVYCLLLVSSADNLVKPLFIGDSLKVHPFLILLSILGGLKIFGVMGVFYGPLIVTIFLTLSELYMLEVEEGGT